MEIGAEKYRWDLGVFYRGLDDPQIARDLDEIKNRAVKFRNEYKGRLNDRLGSAISEYAEIEMLSGKISGYLSLRKSVDLKDSAVKEKLAAIKNELNSNYGENLTFFDIEITSLEDSELSRLYESDETAAKHKPWIERIRSYKPYFLSEEVEAALTTRGYFGPGSWGSFFKEVESDLVFLISGEKKTITEALHTLSESKDVEERALVLKTINDGLGGFFSKYAAQTIYMIAGGKSVEMKERGYANPMSSRNISNQVPDDVVEALHKAVMRDAPFLVKRFYRLKAKLLGLDKLRWSDRNAPMLFADTNIIPFEKALDIVVGAYESFSPTMAEIVVEFISDKRIDAPVSKEKSSGAFNSSMVLPGGKPYSFTSLNYQGSPRDVMTLAHELGHGVHAVLAARVQGPLMFHAPVAYCETASVFGENTTFNFLKGRLKSDGDYKSLLTLIISKIDDEMNTVVRQIGFSNFERRLHGMDKEYAVWGGIKKMSEDELNKIWLSSLKELYGEDGEVFFYENADRLWSYVSHFHRPFYVYGYAFGDLLAQSLYAAKGKTAGDFETLYLELLRAGSTKNAVELLEPFGLDPRKQDFWSNGIKVGIAELLNEAEKLSENIS